MKKLVSISFVFLLFLINCQDAKESSSENRVSPFHKNVGMKISSETAEIWRNRYKESNRASKTEMVPQVSEAALRAMLDPETIGVSFHRARSEDGEYLFLAVPMKQNQPTWAAAQILDTRSNTFVNPQVARNWADRYAIEDPNRVRSNFFGVHVFENEFTTIDLVEGLDEQGATQLMLFILRYQSIGGGRTKGEIVDVYDASVPCPTICNGAEI